MLKIKDTVDLKELEKFGFKYDTFDREYKKHITANEFSDKWREQGKWVKIEKR